MKKHGRFLIFFAVLTLLFSGQVFAERRPETLAPFKKGSGLAGFTTGFSPLAGNHLMLSFNWESGLTGRWGFGYLGANVLTGLFFKEGKTTLGVGLDLNYHYDLKEERFDFYSGVSALVPFVETETPRFGVHVAGRFYYHPAAAMEFRAGFGTNIFSVGVIYAVN